MDWLEAAILGIIQGLSEFLPISSTGHLYLGRHLFGLDEAGLFLDTMLHFGTLIAVLSVYRQEIIELLKKPWNRFNLLLLAGTIPTVLIGLTFKDYFEILSKTGDSIGWEFLMTGILLWAADQIKSQGYKTLEQIRFRDALLIGTFQGLAIMPALSRSGLTIAAALFCRIDKATAAYFSFLLSIPSITGAVLLQSIKMTTSASEMLPLSSLLVGTLFSAIFGYIAVKWMISILQKSSLKGFAIYVLGLGTLILIMQWNGIF
ncbi:undecaprenyl-diphosphate phosphatase [Thermoflavimicrobium dichotomicum]|uniref:Undecaprenyl-diphosphatase n=1 Tax=Thermoflavimicrobium dichotomicum TaxID=46223 RepID=A0A1I3M1B7_9BACL|nr:undecaprenyl-diphosphate phosphatase [Thermoflavimicrobium dichotomicum]SFI90535.1 undecaprenyl-diphosphatase [Thermoflavimicrobium dichotomicum]